MPPLLQMERRERLRKLIAEREAAGEGAPDGAPLIGQVGYGVTLVRGNGVAVRRWCLDRVGW